MKSRTELEMMAGRRELLRQRAWECADALQRWLYRKTRDLPNIETNVYPDWEDATPGASPGRLEVIFFINGEKLTLYQPVDDHPSDEIITYVALLTGK